MRLLKWGALIAGGLAAFRVGHYAFTRWSLLSDEPATDHDVVRRVNLALYDRFPVVNYFANIVLPLKVQDVSGELVKTGGYSPPTHAGPSLIQQSGGQSPWAGAPEYTTTFDLTGIRT